MSHFAKVENGVVTQVIVATQEEINSERHGDAFNWIQCSYNGNFRGIFPGVGSLYLENQFYPEKPYNSWVWDNETTQWVPPLTRPSKDTDDEGMYLQNWVWNEETQSWDEEAIE